jgi:hypothetical protein
LKKISLKLGVQGIKRSENCSDFKIVQKSRVWQRGKNVYRKTEFLRTWKLLQKIIFLIKNLWELPDARVLHIFDISAILRKSTLIRDGAVF